MTRRLTPAERDRAQRAVGITYKAKPREQLKPQQRSILDDVQRVLRAQLELPIADRRREV